MKPKLIPAKLSHDEKRQKLLSSLEDHRHLIKTAVEGMRKGDLRQSLSIATSIRVLIHETGMSKPLLKALKSNYLDLVIMVEPRARPPKNVPGKMVIAHFNVPISVSYSSEEPRIRLGTNIDPFKKSEPCSLGNWWNEPFMNLPAVGTYSRKQLILDVANKEAAHVDMEISEQFKRLVESQFIVFGSPGERPTPLQTGRLLIGRIGLEMLAFLEKHFPAAP
jgi:hypothetical protein